MDLPDVIELRKKYIPETNKRKFISKSVFDSNWYECIEDRNNIMLLIAGVIYYFEEQEVKRLFNDFHTFIPGAEIVCDYSSKRGVEISNKKVIENGGMNKSAYLCWGIDNIFEIEKWDSSIKIISNIPIFKKHKKNYPLIKRIGMNISDKLKVMSLAHIKIN